MRWLINIWLLEGQPDRTYTLQGYINETLLLGVAKGCINRSFGQRAAAKTMECLVLTSR